MKSVWGKNCWFIKNKSTLRGGAIDLISYIESVFKIYGFRFIDNYSGTNGGAINIYEVD